MEYDLFHEIAAIARRSTSLVGISFTCPLSISSSRCSASSTHKASTSASDSSSRLSTIHFARAARSFKFSFLDLGFDFFEAQKVTSSFLLLYGHRFSARSSVDPCHEACGGRRSMQASDMVAMVGPKKSGDFHAYSESIFVNHS